MLLRSFVSETTWVGSGFSDCSRLETRDISGSCCVTSWGKLFSHLRSSSFVETDRALCYWFCDVMAFTKSFDSPSLSQPVLRRESSGPSGSRVARTGRESRSTRESENADAPRLLNCPVLDPPTGGWSNQCPYGAEPRPCPWFLGPCLRHLMLHSFRKRYSYRSFIYV